jgi:diamine N-acetyltransferase
VHIWFIAIEKFNDDLFYLEKLSILPHYRHNSYGRNPVDVALRYIKMMKGKKVSIGVIKEHEFL